MLKAIFALVMSKVMRENTAIYSYICPRQGPFLSCCGEKTRKRVYEREILPDKHEIITKV